MKRSITEFYWVAIAIGLLAFGACCPQAEPRDSIGEKAVDDAFAMIKNLEGEWQGSFKWNGAMQGSGNLKATYYPVGRKAIAENLINEEGEVTMSSIYHLDGPHSLRMTHFCMMNQPRLKATSFEVKDRRIAFDFLDITNLPHENSGHVYAVQLNLIEPDSLHITFKYKEGDDKLSEELARFKRVEINDDQSKLAEP